MLEKVEKNLNMLQNALLLTFIIGFTLCFAALIRDLRNHADIIDELKVQVDELKKRDEWHKKVIDILILKTKDLEDVLFAEDTKVEEENG